MEPASISTQTAIIAANAVVFVQAVLNVSGAYALVLPHNKCATRNASMSKATINTAEPATKLVLAQRSAIKGFALLSAAAENMLAAPKTEIVPQVTLVSIQIPLAPI
jgi:hypothetical protein